MPRSMAALFTVEPARILIHLKTSQAEQMDAALDLAEAYLAKAGSAQVEVIANHRGLELLRVGTTPYAARIAGLKAHHARVGFVACGQTIARLQGAGVEVDLVPETTVAEPRSNTLPIACSRAGLTSRSEPSQAGRTVLASWPNRMRLASSLITGVGLISFASA